MNVMQRSAIGKKAKLWKPFPKVCCFCESWGRCQYLSTPCTLQPSKSSIINIIGASLYSSLYCSLYNGLARRLSDNRAMPCDDCYTVVEGNKIVGKKLRAYTSTTAGTTGYREMCPTIGSGLTRSLRFRLLRLLPLYDKS